MSALLTSIHLRADAGCAYTCVHLASTTRVSRRTSSDHGEDAHVDLPRLGRLYDALFRPVAIDFSLGVCRVGNADLLQAKD